MLFTLPEERGVLETYIDRFRMVFRQRMVTITLLALAVAVCISAKLALQFILVHYALFGLYIVSVERCARRIDAPGAMRRLMMQTTGVAFLIACHGVYLALSIVAHDAALTGICTLMLITMFILTGLQVHLSRLSFLVCMTPFMFGLSRITNLTLEAPATDLWAAGIFGVAVLAASWRQQVSDEASAISAAALTRQNENLQSALAAAEAANRAKTDFLAVTSHEVRTPLNAVLGMAGVLVREAVDERQKGLAQGIERSGNVLLRLLNGILDFAKQEAGKAELHTAPLAVDELLSTLQSVWSAKCEQGEITFEVRAGDGVCGLIIDADGAKLEQTLMNLISNAIKLTPAGGEVIVNAVSQDLNDGGVFLRFEINDRGPGVPESERERIFKPYEQAEAGRAAGGTGLGLAICRGNMQLFGGDIGVTGRDGGGATFWIEFPAMRCEAATVVEAETAEAVTLDGIRILAADDHPANREVLKLLISPLGATLELVEDGLKAVEAAAAAPYDLILMDSQMPGLDGEAAVRRIREAQACGAHSCPIVMVTANVFEDDIARYRAAGCDDVLGKPIDVGALHACVLRLVLGEETALNDDRMDVAAA